MNTSNLAPITALSDEHVQSVVALHFHPELGTRFWLERAESIGLDARARIRTSDDLPLLGPLRREELHARPLRDLVPRALHSDLADLMLSETGGTGGDPLRCVYSEEEFHAGFVRPFMRAARARSFPTDGAWAYIGPSGPHVMHRAARAFARAAGCLEPFSVDFDPRWARSQSTGSLGARLYRDHVAAQAAAVFEREEIRVVFSTPPVLLHLAALLEPSVRSAVRAIHIGGMALDSATRVALAEQFPRAVLLPAYGNSLAGIAPEMAAPEPGSLVAYAVPCDRMRLRVLNRPEDGVFDAAALRAEAPHGVIGRVVLDRLDRSFLLVNLVERDEASTAPAPSLLRVKGFQERLIVDPRPAEEVPAEGGLY